MDVLILVLMEKGGSRGPTRAAALLIPCLNPCFNGKRRIVADERQKKEQASIVLILVLMEKGGSATETYIGELQES